MGQCLPNQRFCIAKKYGPHILSNKLVDCMYVWGPDVVGSTTFRTSLSIHWFYWYSLLANIEKDFDHRWTNQDNVAILVTVAEISRSLMHHIYWPLPWPLPVGPVVHSWIMVAHTYWGLWSDSYLAQPNMWSTHVNGARVWNIRWVHLLRNHWLDNMPIT